MKERMDERMKNKKEELKREVVLTAKRALKEGMVAGTSGNISVFLEDLNAMAITPSGYDYTIMEENDVVVISLDGTVLEGHLKPSSEWKLHAEIYKNLPHVKSVVHTHSPYATSFAVLHKEIPVILIEMVPFLKGSIEVSPYAKQGSSDVGSNAVPILGRKNACLMANHGVVAVGDTLGQAYINSIYVEDAAKIYHMALTVGTPVVLTEDLW
ncbi:class II aldolase/adducin family protein [Lachnoclostridium phytofermentans ISDg]|uniref:Class II aldolase/adducin family protein n=2 Tax=Lachnoclostridium phytofermentans TaxID=66219 RepID=A9KIE7_LACP7|nr:class II aldolase/adducin family protein [Lachnoclostridium phytofermentans ISDg]